MNLKVLQQQVGDLEGKLKRAMADYQNLERRVKDQQSGWVKFANAVLIEKLLQIVDELEQAHEHLKNPGLNLTIGKLKKILEEEGVVKVEAEGREFDHNLMEAVETMAGEKNKVVKVVRAGYILNGQMLRPAKVVVGGKA
ncbi:MAG: nucleotide exchange factor GrpE [Candidatus Chisholmbacteria bacterium]|nr:nucleotide exchange factor GrpE [Candidatus Chisholmbacteria bacterium]